MGEAEETTQDRWARLRFSVVGPLLAAPPPQGELTPELERLAGKVWRHPVTGEPVRFAHSTLERWYSADPLVMWSDFLIGVLAQRVLRRRLHINDIVLSVA
jgi:hypothetical protein